MGDADTRVPDVETECNTSVSEVVGQRDMQPDLSPMREFNGISYEIGQYLPKTPRIDHDMRRNTFVDLIMKAQTGLGCFRGENIQYAFHATVKVHLLLFQLHLPGFDL